CATCILGTGGALTLPIVHLGSLALQAISGRPLLGSCQASAPPQVSVTATQVGNLTAFPPACPVKPYIGVPGTVHQAYSLALQMQVTEWVRLARLAASHSSTLPEVLKSTKADVHLAKMVDSYAPSTLAAYLSKWRHWVRFASACEANPYDPSIALLLDFLASKSRGKLRTATTWIKSLRFISRKAHLDALRSSLHSELVSAYGRSGSIIERRVALQATAVMHPNFTPDFLLARSEGIVLLRQLFSICYAQTQPSSRPEADLLGVHSLKVTLLSYGRQLLIREDLQRQQGHRRSSLTGMSDLYGRDDVAAPLEFQRQVVAAVLEGFRPRRPRLRGGLPPTVDIEVALPCVPGASDMPPVGSNPIPDAEHDTSSDSEVEDVRAASPIPLPPPTQVLPEAITEALSVTLEPLPQDASSSSGAADDWTDVRGQADEFFFLLNGVSHIAHKAQPCCTSHPAFQVKAVTLLHSPTRVVSGTGSNGDAQFSGASQLMAFSSSSTSESASTSFSSEIELFLEAPAADWQPAIRIRPRHFHEARLVHLLFMSTRTERAILLRDEITIWEAAWGNGELHRCVATALYLGLVVLSCLSSAFHAWEMLAALHDHATSRIMAAPPRHDDPAFFQKWCKDMALPSGLLDTLVDKGFNSMALLAFAVPDSDSLEHFIVSIVGRPLGADPSEPLLTADAAALRRLYHLCNTECARIGPATPDSILPSASVKKSLSKEEVAELMQKFMKAYPSELVRADIMPSCPFLMLVREQLDAGKFSWIPWRLRSSASDEEQFLERRRPRTDAKLLTRLLQEGQPEEECIASVPQSGPVEPIVRRFWDLLMYAIALNNGAHLLHLRKAAEKFLSIALATPSDRNMRPPSLQEIVEADRALWLGVASIQADQGWSLTDALAEMIFARPDVYSANKRKQPALPPPPPPKQARPPKAKAKSTSKKEAAPKAISAPSCADILHLAEALLCEAPDLDDRFESGKSVS
ncbi:unnamed protein product, partial [Symbiodinium sp. KB8]